MKPAAEAAGVSAVRRVRLRAIVFLILTLLIAAVAVVLVRASLLKARQHAGELVVKTVPVVVAAADVAVATKLESRHVKTILWPADGVPPGTYRSIQQVVGRSATQALATGEPVLRRRLAGPNKGTGLATLLTQGKRAMAVKVDQVVGIAGFIQPGDSVDVITIMAPDEETDGATTPEVTRIGKIILQNIVVLAVGEQLETTGPQTARVTVVTLEVDPAQSERLALASQHGTVQLTMRSRIDEATVPTAGITPSLLLMPDEGTELPGLRTPVPQVAIAARPVGGVRRPPATKQAPAAAPPVARPPTVEILRPGGVEQRQLRSPPGDQ
jgi:pilus assembly protein CpaB